MNIIDYKNCKFEDMSVGDIVVTDWWVLSEFKKYNGVPGIVIKKTADITDVLYDDNKVGRVMNHSLMKINDKEREIDIGNIKSLF